MRRGFVESEQCCRLLCCFLDGGGGGEGGGQSSGAEEGRATFYGFSVGLEEGRNTLCEWKVGEHQLAEARLVQQRQHPLAGSVPEPELWDSRARQYRENTVMVTASMNVRFGTAATSRK